MLVHTILDHVIESGTLTVGADAGAGLGARVTSITLSEEQLGVAWQRAQEAGLADRVRFELLDYRRLPGFLGRPVDRVVFVGMFEHVGIDHFHGFFRSVKQVLKPDGVALVHAIGRSSGPGRPTPGWRSTSSPAAIPPCCRRSSAPAFG